MAGGEACRTLRLSSIALLDAGAARLAAALRADGAAGRSEVEALNLGINKLTDRGAAALSSALPTSNLKTLSLERNSLTHEGVSAVAGSLPPSLERLMLGRNAVGAEGAGALALALATSQRRLHTLGLGFAGLHAAGAQAIAPAMAWVTVLDLSGNHLGQEGCACLAAGLRSPGALLEVLKLESNGVGDEGARELGVVLAENATLRELEVRRNSITDEGGRLLARALETNVTLRRLDLFDNSITDTGAQALLESALKGKQSGSALNSIELDINDVSAAVKAQIAAALAR